MKPVPMTVERIPDHFPDWIKQHLTQYSEDSEVEHLWDASVFGGKGPTPCLILTTIGRRSGRTLPMPVSRLVTRIESAWNQAPIYSAFSQDTPRLLSLWEKYKSTGAVSELMRERFEAYPEEMDDFLACFVGLAWPMDTVVPHPSDLERSGYDAITTFVEGSCVLGNLRERYGSELDDPVYYHGNDTPLGKKLAHQFAYIHQAVVTEQSDEHPND